MKNKPLPQEELQIFRDQINFSNYKMLRFFAWVWLPLSLVNIFAQSLADSTPMRYLFSASLLFYFISLSIIVHLVKPSSDYHRSTMLIYVVQIFPMIISILLGTILDPNNQAVTIFVLITLMPVLILDKRRNVILWATFWIACFMIASFTLKDPSVFRSDMIHAIEFYFVSVAVTIAVVNNRVDSIQNYVDALPNVTDLLTGLQNTSRFFEKSAMIRDRRSNDLFSVIYFNFSNLKRHNEIYGYHSGSDLLKNFASLLRENYGEEYCARFNDDHFVVLASRDSFLEKLNQIMAAGEEMSDVCHLYAGIYDLEDYDRIEIACDRAKSASEYLRVSHNRNRIQLYDDKFRKKEEHSQYIQYHVDQAVSEGWIEAYFQPIIRASTNKVCNEEALARWVDPKRGVISPGEFIPILEESRQLFKVDLEIVRQVAASIQKRREAGMEICPISVNLSRYDFEAADMVRRICEILDAADVPHHQIVIEITESAILSQEDLIRREIERFHEAGFHVWMDDFGSGYSSLNLLTKFRFDQIKLDMEFSLRMAEDKNNVLVIRHIIEMAQELGIDTLAEGIETEEHYRVFKEIGCDKLQGYLFGKAVPMKTILGARKKGTLLPYEGEKEHSYYEKIGRLCFSDVISGQNSGYEYETLENPLAVLELEDDNTTIRVLRSNREYISFLKKIGRIPQDCDDKIITFQISQEFGLYRIMHDARNNENWISARDETILNYTVTSYARNIAHNDVSGKDAVLISIIDYYDAENTQPEATAS